MRVHQALILREKIGNFADKPIELGKNLGQPEFASEFLLNQMKTSHFIILSILALAQVGCEKPSSTGAETPMEDKVTILDFFPSPPVKSPFPINRTIHDNQGRPLEGVIIAKTNDQIYVTRGFDGMSFKIAIDSLQDSDRKFAEELPDQVPPGDFRLGLPTAPEEIPAYILSRQDSIKRLVDENKRLQGEITSTSNTMLQRSRRSEIKRNEQEILRLEEAIKTYKTQNP